MFLLDLGKTHVAPLHSAEYPQHECPPEPQAAYLVLKMFPSVPLVSYLFFQVSLYFSSLSD